MEHRVPVAQKGIKMNPRIKLMYREALKHKKAIGATRYNNKVCISISYKCNQLVSYSVMLSPTHTEHELIQRIIAP